jgi:hypothetical protein
MIQEPQTAGALNHGNWVHGTSDVWTDLSTGDVVNVEDFSEYAENNGSSQSLAKTVT